MIAYLDTHTLIWISEKSLRKLSKPAQAAIEEHELLVSPVVLLELQYLHEIGRILQPPALILHQLKTQIGLGVCEYPFPKIVEVAMLESWTRDPFDRMIVANARANGYAPLITSDAAIRKNYPRGVW